MFKQNVSYNSSILSIIKLFKSEYTEQVFQFGDVDNDQDIDLMDLVKLSNYTAQGYNFPILLNACDVDCDGEVNVDDVNYFADYLYHSGPKPGTDCMFYYDGE